MFKSSLTFSVADNFAINYYLSTYHIQKKAELIFLWVITAIAQDFIVYDIEWGLCHAKRYCKVRCHVRCIITRQEVLWKVSQLHFWPQVRILSHQEGLQGRASHRACFYTMKCATNNTWLCMWPSMKVLPHWEVLQGITSFWACCYMVRVVAVSHHLWP